VVQAASLNQHNASLSQYKLLPLAALHSCLTREHVPSAGSIILIEPKN
jgi:hypothetical protein